MPTQTNPNVSANSPIIEGNTEKMWLPVWKDRFGVPITTKAGLVPIKPSWELHSVVRYDVEIYVNSYSDAAFSAQFNAINSDTWRGVWAPGKAWIGNIHWEAAVLGAFSGFLIRYAIYCTDLYDGWKFCHPNVAYTYRDGTNQKAFLASGIPYIGNLNDDGERAEDGALTGLPVMTILTADTKKELNFTASLGF